MSRQRENRMIVKQKEIQALQQKVEDVLAKEKMIHNGLPYLWNDALPGEGIKFRRLHPCYINK